MRTEEKEVHENDLTLEGKWSKCHQDANVTMKSY